MRPTGPIYDLPTPMLPIGYKVEPFPVEGWHRRRIVRSLVRHNIEVLKRLRRKGYAKREPSEAVLNSHVKKQMRAFMDVVDNTYEVEVAGLVAVGHHLNAMPVNGCYVGGGTGWSGVDFYCQLLWRAKVGLDHVVVLQPLDTVPYGFSQQFCLNKPADPQLRT